MMERRAGGADEAALVRAVASGSEEALATLYDRHVDGVHAVALRLTGDRGSPRRSCRRRSSRSGTGPSCSIPALASLGTWLRTIARNRTVDRLRALGPPADARRRSGVTGTPTRRTPAWTAWGRMPTVLGGRCPDPGPEDAAEAASVRAAIAAALATMPEAERMVIVLAYREGLTQQEIAERLAWPLGTVKTRTRRALARLRDAARGG